MEINQKNSNNQCHGYWEKYRDREKKELWYKCHYLNDILIGYDELFDHNNEVCYYTTRLNGQEIGCEQYRNSQRFYKTPGEKFGEEIKWK